MATSFVEFEGYGFWVSDGLLEEWLFCLVREIDALTDAPDWLRALGQELYDSAAYHGMGALGVGWSEIVSTEERRRQIIAISQHALNTLEEHHGVTEKDLVIAWWLGYELSEVSLNQWLRESEDFAFTNLCKTGRQFIRLLMRQWPFVNGSREADSWLYSE